MSLRRPLVGATLAAFVATAGLAQTLEPWGTAGGWDILVDPSLGNGCLIQAEFQDGSVVRIGFDRTQDNGYITAFNSNWGAIEDGAEYDISYDLDGQEYTGTATGIYLNGVPGADLAFDNVDLLIDIAAKYTMTLYHEDAEVMAIDLAGSSAALQEAIACQDEMG